MPLTWESCRHNPDVDWLIFTDQRRTPEMPENVKLIPIQLQDFTVDLFKRLRLDGEAPSLCAYKFCDFKATWGEAFQDRLRDYPFWGACDLDIVWGQIRAFHPEDVLSRFDILTSFRSCMSGACTIFRNTPAVNHLFRTIPDYGQILRENRIFSMDETLLNDAAIREEKARGLRVLRRRLCVSEMWEDWNEWAERVVLEEEGTLSNFPRLLGASYWEKGRIFHSATRTEMAYHHFMRGKKRYPKQAWSYPFWSDCMTGMEMGPRGIKMHFKPNCVRARIRHYFLTRFGRLPLDLVQNAVPYTISFIKMLLKRIFPGWVAVYKRHKVAGNIQPPRQAF
jgi:hypothetical protein